MAAGTFHRIRDEFEVVLRDLEGIMPDATVAELTDVLVSKHEVDMSKSSGDSCTSSGLR